MMYNYDNKPGWAFDPVYAPFGSDMDTIYLLRFLITYQDLVNQRYTAYSFPTDWQTAAWSKPFRKSLMALGDRDPAHFAAFVLEVWERREHYAKYRDKWKLDYAGLSYPAIGGVNGIAIRAKQLIQDFLNIREYKPKEFVPKDDAIERDKRIMRRQVERWCAAHEKTEREYWLCPEHLFPPYLTAAWIKHADSLWEMDEEIEQVFGFSVQELEEALPSLEKMTWRGVQTTVLPKERLFWDDVETLDRIDRGVEALERGMDITSVEYERAVDG